MNTAVFIKGSKEKSKILKNENWKKKKWKLPFGTWEKVLNIL